MTTAIKSLAARLPARSQQTLKRWHFARQIANGTFNTSEPEYARLSEWIRPGDWVIDIGANVGHYAYRFSELVGPSGYVLAFEPIPDTFELLTANLARAPHRNVRLFNIAVSDAIKSQSMLVGAGGNYYRSHISAEGDVPVYCVPMDALCVPHRVSLVKIDVEGHEAEVLAGMRSLILASKPVLIVETHDPEVIASVLALGYYAERMSGSPNVLFRPR